MCVCVICANNVMCECVHVCQLEVCNVRQCECVSVRASPAPRAQRDLVNFNARHSVSPQPRLGTVLT